MNIAQDQIAIYEGIFEQELKSSDRGMYFLSYLKIRCLCLSRAGYFDFSSFTFATGLHQKTAKKHLSALINKGFVLKVGEDRYNCLSLKKITNSKRGALFVKVDIDFIMSMSWKTMAQFRAFMVECFYEKLEYKKLRYRKKKEVYTVDLRSGKRVKTLNDRFLGSEFHHKVSTTYGRKCFGFSTSTFSRYRKLNNDVNYYSRSFVVYNKEEVFSKKISDMIYSFVGKSFELTNGGMLYSAVPYRKSSIRLFKHTPSGRTPKRGVVSKTFPLDNSMPF